MIARSLPLFLSLLLLCCTSVASAWVAQPTTTTTRKLLHATPSSFSSVAAAASTSTISTTQLFSSVKTKDEEGTTTTTDSANNKVEETTEKYGLEAGLFQSIKQKDGGESAKSLLKKYGIAYLATSIPLAIVSFAICYVLVDNGVDVSSLLAKVGIETNAEYAEKAGTAAIAYAAHKAASPIRFPPTVILTPVVAKLIGKEPAEPEEDAEPEASSS